MKKYIFLAILSNPLLLFSQNNDALFSQATESYNSGNFQKAVESYMSILDSGFESSALYYNLANAHYKLNHVPESIYYYEKALKLNPENEDAKNNLVFANQMTVDAITPLPKTWFKNLSDSIVSLFSLSTWAIFPIIGVFVFVISFLLYYFLEKTIFKRLFFTTMLLGLICSIGTYFIADFHRKNIENEKYAILFEKTVRVFSEPNAFSAEAFLLHEGTKVEIIESLNDWVKIKLADGKIGWAKESTLKFL
ncbi:tetratricopeptide repeat protein [Capnocytophaga felis]|nr:tetratricopeptide repeat protein [Capnocytophaga felis]